MLPGSLRVGDSVIINAPENDRLDRTKGVVREVTPWGAHLFSEAAASRQFRASWDEMELLREVNGQMDKAVQQGYTGDVCPACGGLKMRRAGSCLCCDDCGGTSGCG